MAPSGLVVAAGFARRTLLDAPWTVLMAQRLVELAEARPQGQPLRVLYPACGPSFSPLLLAMLGAGPERFATTMIDVASMSLHLAELVVDALALRAGVYQFVHADAVRWDDQNTYDVLLLGVPLQGLKHEAHFAIACNLAPRVAAEGVMVPAAVDAVLIEVNGQDELGVVDGRIVEDGSGPVRAMNRHDMRPLFRLDLRAARELGRPAALTSSRYALPDVGGPVSFTPGYYPAIALRITIDGGTPIADRLGGSPALLVLPLLEDVDERGWALDFDIAQAAGFQLRPR